MLRSSSLPHALRRLCPHRSCGYVFCSGHRHAQDHNCSFDYAAFDKVCNLCCYDRLSS